MYLCASRRSSLFATPSSILWMGDPCNASARDSTALVTGDFLPKGWGKCAYVRGTKGWRGLLTTTGTTVSWAFLQCFFFFCFDWLGGLLKGNLRWRFYHLCFCLPQHSFKGPSPPLPPPQQPRQPQPQPPPPPPRPQQPRQRQRQAPQQKQQPEMKKRNKEVLGVMHPSVPDECKPILLHGTKRVPFPLPVKKIKQPKKLKNDSDALGAFKDAAAEGEA